MRPDKLTVYEVFEKQRRYVVPLFQRPYVWTKEGQWQSLWDDISSKARAVERRSTQVPHFLGAIVTSQRPVYGREMNAWEIIDGQQRLTTLQIVLAALRDFAIASGRTAFVPELQRLTRNDGVVQDEHERYKVWPTSSDQRAFVTVLHAGSIEVLAGQFPALKGKKRRRGHAFAEAYVYFYSAIENFVSTHDAEQGEQSQPDSRFDALFETFRRYLQFVTMELEAGDDPQVIFESLNARGVPLLPSDLIRNYVFLRASRQSSRLDELYAACWRDYDERPDPDGGADTRFWKVEERQGRFRRSRLDLFLFHYLQYRLEQEVNIGHLFQEFRSWLEHEDQKGHVESALIDMRRFADGFAQLISPSDQGRVALFARHLRILDTSTLYPLLLLLLVEATHELSTTERDGILDDLESYLVRRTLCGLTTKHYNITFLSLIRGLRKMGISRQNLRELLAAGSGESVRWPNDSELGYAILHRPLYRALRQDVLRMILTAVDQCMATSKSETFRLSTKLSIEHVMPQTWRGSDWPSPPSAEAETRRDVLIDTLGNLTLITGALNSSVSNDSFDRKKAEYFTHSLLLLNKHFAQCQTWSEENILRRGRLLLETVRTLWPHPDSPLSLDDVTFAEPSLTALAGENEPDDYLPPVSLPSATALLDEFARLEAIQQTS